MMLDPQRFWYRHSLTAFTCSLLPFSWLFRSIVASRRFLYRHKIKKSFQFPVPIIVVGNITVGGTGKTPCVIWLAELLRKNGYKPGIVSRGVGGIKQDTPYWVEENSDVATVGDEAVLLAKRSQSPLVICVDRVAAVKELLSRVECDVVISDDGLQHYRMGRDIEIVIIDGMRGLGNEQLLPAGPLREPVARLGEVDFILHHPPLGESWSAGLANGMTLSANQIVSVKDKTKIMSIEKFNHRRIHAVAAIGNPKRFFDMLREKDFDVIPHVFPDHYQFNAKDFVFSDALPVIMTEKDAVKCHGFAEENWWYIPVAAQMDQEFEKKLLAQLSHSLI